MITLNIFDLMSISTAIWADIEQKKRLIDALSCERTKETYKKQIKRLNEIRDMINEARDQTIERKSIRIACKL